MVWLDEAGFCLLPAVLRTYAPAGPTPIIRHCLTNDHLSAISGIIPDDKLYMQVQEDAVRAPNVVCFLKHLLRRIPGQLLVNWDGSPTHCGQAVKEFLASGAANPVHMERLPGYAPDLNPDEGIWQHLKRVELRNLSCDNLDHLRRELRKPRNGCATRRISSRLASDSPAAHSKPYTDQ